jgi:hypothetical protein
MDETNAYHYSLGLVGVFGRNKKPKFKLFELGRVAENNVAEQDEMVASGKRMLATLKAQPGCKYWVQVQPMHVDADGTFSFMCFTHYKLVEGKV